MKSFWNITEQEGFRSFLMPFFETTMISTAMQGEFNQAIESFHSVYANEQIVSLKKASKRILIAAGLVFILAGFIIASTKNSKLGIIIEYGFFMLALLMLMLILIFFCCYHTYYSETQKLIHIEKQNYPWYDSRIDMNRNERNCKMSDSIKRITHWFVEKILVRESMSEKE